MLIYGTKFFGQIETIGKHIYVATRFHHIFLIPIVYQGSYIVVDDAHALRIPLNIKSILFAYFRVLLGIVFIFATLILMMLMSGPSWDNEVRIVALLTFGTMLLSLVGAFLSFRLGKSNESKKAYILEVLESNREKIVDLGGMHVQFE